MRFEVYQDRQREWRWRLRHRNGSILAKSSEGYRAKADCMTCIATTQKSSAAEIIEI